MAALLLLIVVHYLAGHGLLQLFRLPTRGLAATALAIMCGIVVLSMVPFLLQLFYVPITLMSVSVLISLTILVLHARMFRSSRFFTGDRRKLRLQWSEVPFLLFTALLMIASAVRCWWDPPKARDVLSGPEAIAEYTVREHTMINSVLSVDLQTTNNHLKPPFITGLQIIYKLFGMPFGQLWIIVFAISFTVWLWLWLRRVVHPFFAGLLLVLFTAIPELYAYTHIILWDYANMVFFFLGFYFLKDALSTSRRSLLFFSALLFGFATYIRIETVLFIGMLLPLIVVATWTKGWKITVGNCATTLIVPFVFYFLWVGLFLKHYMPEGFTVESQLNPHLSQVHLLWQRFADINTQLIFCTDAIDLWSYFLFLFCGVLLCELIFYRSIKQESRWWLYGFAVIYFGLAVLGYITPYADLMNTTKRGLFKLLPFALAYMAISRPVQWLSHKPAIFDVSTKKGTATNPDKPADPARGHSL